MTATFITLAVLVVTCAFVLGVTIGRAAGLGLALRALRAKRTNLPGHSYDLALTHAEDEVRRLMEGER